MLVFLHFLHEEICNLILCAVPQGDDPTLLLFFRDCTCKELLLDVSLFLFSLLDKVLLSRWNNHV